LVKREAKNKQKREKEKTASHKINKIPFNSLFLRLYREERRE
jgi:hypothetical protein